MIVTDVESILTESLEHLTDRDWSSIRERSRQKMAWHKLEWWHNKYYKANAPNDGNSVQVPRKGEPEIPYSRELFYPSPASRFSLGTSDPVSYFSSDFGVNCCETIEQFSSNPSLRFEELARYLGGEGNPTPGWHGYPLNFHIVEAAVVMDVATDTSPFYRTLSLKIGEPKTKTFRKHLRGRHDSDKNATQCVSTAARGFDIHGIVYASVRTPVDVSIPRWNLVMFEPEMVRSGMPPNKGD